MKCSQHPNLPTKLAEEPLLCCIVYHGFALSFINRYALRELGPSLMDFIAIVDKKRDNLCNVFDWLSYCITIACPYFYDDLILYLQNLTNRDVGLEIFKFTFPTQDTDMSFMVGWALRENVIPLNEVKRVLFGEYGWFNDDDDHGIVRGFDCICYIHPQTMQRGLIVEFGTEETVLFVFNVFVQQYPCANV